MVTLLLLHVHVITQLQSYKIKEERRLDRDQNIKNSPWVCLRLLALLALTNIIPNHIFSMHTKLLWYQILGLKSILYCHFCALWITSFKLVLIPLLQIHSLLLLIEIIMILFDLIWMDRINRQLRQQLYLLVLILISGTCTIRYEYSPIDPLIS